MAVRVFDIRITGNQRLMNYLNRVRTKLPIRVRERINTWGIQLKKKYKNHLKSKHDSTRIAPSVKWLNLTKTKTRGQISMRIEGLFLSAAEPHFVSIKRRPRLRRWIEKKAPHLIGKGAIYVRPHPFIIQIYNQHQPRLRGYLRRAVDMATRT